MMAVSGRRHSGHAGGLGDERVREVIESTSGRIPNRTGGALRQDDGKVTSRLPDPSGAAKRTTGRSGQGADQDHAAGSGERDDHGHPGIRPGKIAVRVPSVGRSPEAEAQERLYRPEEGQDHETVEGQLVQHPGEGFHTSRLLPECYKSMTLGRLFGGEVTRRCVQSRRDPISA